MKKSSNEQMLKACIMFGTLVIILVVIIGIILRYQVEGEKNVPFYVSEMNIISTAEGIGNQQEENNEIRWNMNIFQNNDIYLKIAKNANNKNEEKIEKIAIENLQVTKSPKKGNILAYMPNSTEGRTFSYEEQYIFKNQLTYTGASKSDQQNLEIGNQGGTIVFRISNANIGNYQSNEDEEVIHNGTILNKINASMEEVQFEVLFDLAIYMDHKVYRTSIQLELPTGNIIEEGTSYIEKKEMSELVYKRYFFLKE